MVKNNTINNFIFTLLANKKMTNIQKEKICSLIIRDFGLDPKKSQGESKVNLSSKDLPDYHSPKDVMDFLFEYNQDSVLKYTCHPIDDVNVINEIINQCEDETYSVESHYYLISKRFQQLRDRYDSKKTGKYLDYKVINLMKVYIDGTTLSDGECRWSHLQIPYNWHSQNLWTWSKANVGAVPNPGENIAEFLCNEGYILPTPIISNLTGKKIRTFGDIVMYYKSLFHIKRDDNLKNKILYIYKNGYQTGDQNSHSWVERVDLTIGEFDNNIELFTSVDKLLQAFISILKICVDVQKQYSKDIPLIEICFYKEKETNRICFSVHHKNSEYRKTLEDAIRRIGEQQTNLIKNQINGICDLYIQADFGNGDYAELNLWDGKERIGRKISKIEGVKYIMKY